MLKYALLYLLALVCLAYGFAVGHLEIFPYQWLMTVKDQILYVKNDLTGGVERFLVPYDDYDPQRYRPVASDVIPERDAPLVRRNNPLPGQLLLYGTFDFDPPTHAAILLDRYRRIRHVWRVNEDAVTGHDVRKATNKFPHGIQVLPDGSIIFIYDEGSSIQRFDACSEPMWTTPGHFNHTVSIDADGKHVWSLLDEADKPPNPDDKASWRILARVDIDTGKITRRISLRQIIDANPGVDILSINQDDLPEGPVWQPDAFHENDIEPLPRSMADAFPRFSAGDLLISLRALDLIMVLDPDTLKIKWWRIGQTRRQHDPDWQPDGSITVFDNDMNRGPLRIVKIWPQNFHAQVLYDGRQDGAFSTIRGKHQVLADGSILVTVPQQGRVLEKAPDGRTTFELINRYRPEPGQDLLVSEARWLPSDFFNFEEFPSCAH